MSNFQPHEVVGRDSETQLQVAENMNKITTVSPRINVHALISENRLF